MKKITLSLIALSIAFAGFAQKDKNADKGTKQSKNKSMTQEKKSFEDSVSYVIGFNLGQNIKAESFAFNVEQIAQGMKDAFTSATPMFTEEEMSNVMTEWQTRMMNAQNAEKAEESTKNKEIGAKFLAENKKNNPNVKETASGLQYLVVTEGTGPKPVATDHVKVHYKGTLIDGTVFDSSYERGEPIDFPLNQVIAGWTEGVQLMSKGSKYIFYIPSNLAYGEAGAGAVIPAGATLIFEVELLDINPVK